ncbi:hypothetical protein GUJ93_ZPchr0010g10715 [Zizania palustris]|uniref:Uncharacterized protein n=1 Tax=Zizania palustris TaxID=103762 RepID=A0A8J5WAU8_ZIZPA|nr:hypothetical protein GUJ93_ZPchr0010g10715 [Zizania palustris]
MRQYQRGKTIPTATRGTRIPLAWPGTGRSKIWPCKSIGRMSDVDEYRCFVGSLSWSTTEVGLKDAFGKFGHLTGAKVVLDKFSGRSRGFGFVTFDDKKAMEEAIEAMNGMDLDGRNITVERAQPQSSGRDRDGDRDYSRDGVDRDRYRSDYGRGRDRGQDFRGGRGGGGGDCFKCGKPGHFARECPSGDDGREDRYGGRDDRYGGNNGSNRYGPDRGGDRYSGSRDGGSRNAGGGDRYSRDRSFSGLPDIFLIVIWDTCFCSDLMVTKLSCINALELLPFPLLPQNPERVLLLLHSYLLPSDYPSMRSLKYSSLFLLEVLDVETRASPAKLEVLVASILNGSALFGKVAKDMDYRYPLSAFQAFAICLTSFDTKQVGL